MDLGRLRRLSVALAAAYALALHGLLSAFIPLPPSVLAGPVAVLCTYDNGDGTGAPEHQGPSCIAICSVLGHGTAGAPPSDVLAVRLPFAVVAAPTVRIGWVAPSHSPSGPQVPRAPPLA